MFYCFENFLVDDDRIASSQVCQPLLFESFLIVGDHKSAHVGIFFWSLQLLTIYGSPYEAVRNVGHGVDFKNYLVNNGIVATTEDALFGYYAFYGVGIERGPQGLVPLAEIEFPDTFPYRLDVSLVADEESNAFIAWFAPSILFLVFLFISQNSVAK